MNQSKLLLLGAILFSVVNSAQALTLTTYTDRAAWEAALASSTSTIDFNGLTSSAQAVPSYSADGVDFSVSGGQLYLVESLSYDAAYLNSGYLEWQNANPNTMTFNMGASNAFAFDYGDFYGNLRTFDINVQGDIYSVSTAVNDYSFFGVIANGDIGSFDINVTADNFPIIDNFSYATSVPEAGAFALLAIGLAGMGFRRKNKAA